MCNCKIVINYGSVGVMVFWFEKIIMVEVVV